MRATRAVLAAIMFAAAILGAVALAPEGVAASYDSRNTPECVTGHRCGARVSDAAWHQEYVVASYVTCDWSGCYYFTRTAWHECGFAACMDWIVFPAIGGARVYNIRLMNYDPYSYIAATSDWGP